MDVKQRAARIRLVVFDVDGVLTDGRLYYGAGGEELKVFHVHDGQGIKRLQKAGVKVAIISGRDSAAVTRRMQDLGIEHVFQGDEDNGAMSSHYVFNRLGLFPKLTTDVFGVSRPDEIGAMAKVVATSPCLVM